MARSALSYLPPPSAPPDVIYQDEFLLAINKPSGLLTVPGRGPDKADCLIARTHHRFPEAKVVHRLDMETSGLILFARDLNTQRALGQLFESRRMQKTYVAVVNGKPEPESGEINAPLTADWPNRPRQKVDFESGKPSCTRYHVITADLLQNRSRLRLHPVTGRSHQLRVHLLWLGHPIVGDTLYGTPSPQGSSNRLMLHAESLVFEHPITCEPLKLYCPTPF